MRELEGAGTLDVLGRENVFPATAVLGESVARARAAAERWLATRRPAEGPSR